jgi:ferric-dicitrate binding protein FerR (iron transport regulator)
MKRIRTTVVTLAVIALAAGSAAVSETERSAIGQVTSRAPFDVMADGETIEISDGAYPYFTGETISTRESNGAVLALSEGSLKLAPETIALLENSPEAYRIVLERGAVRIRLEGPFVLEVGMLRIRPTSPGCDVLVIAGDNGSVVLQSFEGALEAEGPGDNTRLVTAGQTRTFSATTATKDVSAAAATGSSLLGKWAPYLGGGAALSGGGVAVEKANDDDDSDDDPLTSPTH